MSSEILPDVLDHGLRVVFCGTAASRRSAARRSYYAGFGNAFWKTLHEVGLTPAYVLPEQFRTITEFGLGLTDLAKRISGVDADLSASDFGRDDVRRKMLRFQPSFLAFTSKRAAQEFLGYRVRYGLQDEQIGETRLFVLPSPSGAARRYWDLEVWAVLSRLARIEG